jgi:tetratricopeptide (TPR) repeat protein
VQSTIPIGVTLGTLMHRARLSWWLAAAVLAVLIAAPVAAATGGSKDARRVYDEATAAFGLGRYAEAAEKYEAAFSLRPDPALLYNAAQSYRLAGNKQRALELYRNYVRLYPDATNAPDARTHVATLKKVIDDERPATEAARPPVAPPAVAPAPAAPQPRTATAPPVATLPPATAMPPAVEARPVAPLPSAPPPPATDANVPMVTRPAPAAGEEQKSLTQQTWFWVAVGAAVAVAGTTVLLLATRGEKFPDATYGSARGN